MRLIDLFNHLGIGIGQDSDSQQSTTKGGIYTSNVIITDKAEQEQLAKTQGQTLEQNIANAKIDISTDEFSQQGAKANGALNNNFDKDQVQKELNVQTEVTKQFGQNAPKVVADFSDNRMLAIAQNANLSEEEKQSEMAKWKESGVYRVALHTAVGALATGNIDGALSAGTTAYSIPKIDEKLKELGFGEEVQSGVLLGLSAGIGGLTDNMASVANNVNQTQNNYLSHRELMDKIIEMKSCLFTKECIKQVNEKYDEISKQNDIKLANDCKNSINSNCIDKMKDALDYVGDNRTDPLKTDITSSRKRVLDIANSTGYSAISTLDMRADYFGAMYAYTGQPWFRVAEKHSIGRLRMANHTGFSDWISEAGNAIMKKGKLEFQYIYKNHENETNSWSYRRLHNEQNDPVLQTIHEKHYNSWSSLTRLYVNSQVGGKFLNPQHRFNTGCEDMPEVKECK